MKRYFVLFVLILVAGCSGQPPAGGNGPVGKHREPKPVHSPAVTVPAGQEQRLAEIKVRLRDPNPEARQTAARELGQTRDPAAVPLCLALLDDEDLYVQVYAIQSLRMLRDERALPTLCRMLDEDHDPLVYSNIMRTLETIGSRDAVPALIHATRSRDPSVRYDAARALGELGDSRAVAALEALLEDEDTPERRDKRGVIQTTNGDRVCDQARRSLEKIREQ